MAKNKEADESKSSEFLCISNPCNFNHSQFSDSLIQVEYSKDGNFKSYFPAKIFYLRRWIIRLSIQWFNVVLETWRDDDWMNDSIKINFLGSEFLFTLLCSLGPISQRNEFVSSRNWRPSLSTTFLLFPPPESRLLPFLPSLLQLWMHVHVRQFLM